MILFLGHHSRRFASSLPSITPTSLERVKSAWTFLMIHRSGTLCWHLKRYVLVYWVFCRSRSGMIHLICRLEGCCSGMRRSFGVRLNNGPNNMLPIQNELYLQTFKCLFHPNYCYFSRRFLLKINFCFFHIQPLQNEIKFIKAVKNWRESSEIRVIIKFEKNIINFVRKK